jgi:hypothetical protein
MHTWKQSESFKQHARHFSTVSLNLEGTEQSPTGGHEREPELVQVPSAVVNETRHKEREMVLRMSCIVGGTLKRV